MLARLLVCCSVLLLTLPANALTVAGFGDSLTSSPSYLDFLAADTVISGGLGGETTVGGVARIEPWLTMSASAADFVIVLEGTNDLVRSGYNQATVAANLSSMAEVLLANSVTPILLAPPPILPNGDPLRDTADARAVALASALRGIADGLGVTFIDLHAVFSSATDTTALFSADGLHPNSLGHQLIAAQVNAVITPEPSTALLLGFGLAVMSAPRRNARRLLLLGANPVAAENQ